MRTRDSVSDAYSAEQVLTKCLLLALFFFHLFRTYYFPERLRWIHLGYRALRDSPCAREAHSPAGVADTEQRPSPEEPPRAKRRSCAGVRIAPGPADAARRRARHHLRLRWGVGPREAAMSKGPPSPSVLEPGREAGLGLPGLPAQTERTSALGTGPGFLRSPDRAGTGVST